MADNLFEGLPPPSQPQHRQQSQFPIKHDSIKNKESDPVPTPILKSALKRSKPIDSTVEPEAPAPERRIRFKTTTDASETQVIEAMQKVASHIKNPTKFAKASKLAIQLIEAGSVKPATSDQFFAILEAAMSSSTSCTDPSVRASYHSLFSAAQNVSDCLNKKQKNLLTTWTLRAVVANDLFTDDSFVFSKTAGQIKEAISDLPVSTKEDDLEEASTLNNEAEHEIEDDGSTKPDMPVTAAVGEIKNDESDIFGLDALIPTIVKKEDTNKGAKGAIKEEEQEDKRFLKSQREALITCLEIAARRYKLPWCQTVIDILVKHASDNASKFTSRQRIAVEKLMASINEQHNRRKQGKSVTGKLDVTAFELLQHKYANEKMSIRRSVGGSGDRRAQQWLG